MVDDVIFYVGPHFSVEIRVIRKRGQKSKLSLDETSIKPKVEIVFGHPRREIEHASFNTHLVQSRCHLQERAHFDESVWGARMTLAQECAH